jgi:hypothetical protein
MLSLIPKVENVIEMKMFRSISLVNCSFKFFNKVLTLRLEKMWKRLVSKEQSVVIARYLIHCKSKRPDCSASRPSSVAVTTAVTQHKPIEIKKACVPDS